MNGEEIITVAGDGITISNLVWRRFRRAKPGMAEAVFAANPGLAAMGAIIPVGTRVRFPAMADSAGESDVITLWD